MRVQKENHQSLEKRLNQSQIIIRKLKLRKTKEKAH